jgi:hypothetical protein
VGCDINPQCSVLTYQDSRIGVVVGDANLPENKERILALSPQYDIIIDDGSHESHDIVKSFGYYFGNVVDGGLFVAEDLHCSYWQPYEGGLFHPHSSIAFFKRLADITNHEHWGVPKARCDIVQTFASRYGAQFDEELLTHIHSVEFLNSVCVVRKEAPPANVLGPRVIAGEQELVVPGHHSHHGTTCMRLDQRANPWASREVSVEEELPVRLHLMAELQQTLALRDQQIAQLTAQLAERDDG